MAYNFGGPMHSDQNLDHVPDFKEVVDESVRCARSVVYIGWRPHDSGTAFFDWLRHCAEDKLVLMVEAWKPNYEAFIDGGNLFKAHGRAEMLLDLVPPWMRDCIVWQDGPEHLANDNSERLIKSWQLLGFKSIVLSTPDGWMTQDALDGNDFERHLGAWTKPTYQSLGFHVEHYSAGLIGLWQKS